MFTKDKRTSTTVECKSIMFSFGGNLLNIWEVPDSVLGIGEMAINEASKISHGVSIPVGEVGNNQENINWGHNNNNDSIKEDFSSSYYVPGIAFKCSLYLFSLTITLWSRFVSVLQMRRHRHREAK